jgi:filamentous hemagglutinin
MTQNINGIEIHYVRNMRTGAIDNFKFKWSSLRNP